MMPWTIEDKIDLGNMHDYYSHYLAPFGELLTDMESIGIKVDTQNHLKKAEQLARIERDKMLDMFNTWVQKHCPDAKYINTASTIQMQQLFFGHYENKDFISKDRVFKIAKDQDEIDMEKSKAIEENPLAGKERKNLVTVYMSSMKLFLYVYTHASL